MEKTQNTVSAQVMKLIGAEHAAFINEVKAGQSVYKAFVALVKAIPLNDAAGVIAVCAAIRTEYGTAETSAQLRITLINNARRVEHGGTKNKVVIKGRGRAVLLAVFDKANTLNELKAALADAKPEGLKEVSTGGREARKAEPSKAEPSKPLDIAKVPVQGTAPDAIQALNKVLDFVETFLDSGSDSALINMAEALRKALATRFAKVEPSKVEPSKVEPSKAKGKMRKAA